MDVLDKQISKEANVKVEIVGGKIEVAAALDTAGVDVGAKITVEVDYFIDALAAKIPGAVDDAIFGVLKAALKQI